MNARILIGIITVAASVCATRNAHAQDGAHANIRDNATTAITAATTRVPVATRDLARGYVLTESDIRWTDTTGISSARWDTARVAAGWVARRSIRAGEILRSPSVSLPDLVSNGDAVDVVYSAPGITIKVRGTAIGSGGEGDQIFVKLENRKRLRAVVAGANTVRVM